jgi:cytochrome c553
VGVSRILAAALPSASPSVAALSYVIAKLANWSKERGQDPNNPDTSQIMGPIAEKLTKDQIAAVAAYVSGRK